MLNMIPINRPLKNLSSAFLSVRNTTFPTGLGHHTLSSQLSFSDRIRFAPSCVCINAVKPQVISRVLKRGLLQRAEQGYINRAAHQRSGRCIFRHQSLRDNFLTEDVTLSNSKDPQQIPWGSSVLRLGQPRTSWEAPSLRSPSRKIFATLWSPFVTLLHLLESQVHIISGGRWFASHSKGPSFTALKQHHRVGQMVSA